MKRQWCCTLALAFLIGLLSFSSGIANSETQESPYKLPYPAGKEYKVSQGNFGKKSHNPNVDNGKAIYAFDFNLKDGDLVVASRSGRVLSTQDGFNRGYCNPALGNDVNYVLIDHRDGTSSLYLHLKKGTIEVKDGDDVLQGQPIAQADASGYVCGITGEHLHFQVQETPQNIWIDSEGKNRGWYTQSIQISFSDADVLAKTSDGIPIAGENYISNNAAPKVITLPPQVSCPAEGKLKFSLRQEVITTDDLKVRENPGLSSREITTQSRGVLGKILEGPVCQDNYVWWKIEYSDQTIGWSAEDWLEVRTITKGKIAYINLHDGRIYLTSADGAAPRKVSQEPAAMFEWFPDGRRILYFRSDDHGSITPGLFVIDTDEGKETEIPGRKVPIKLSPDGKKFLYWEGDYQNQTLAIFDLESKSSRLLAIQQTYERVEIGVSLGIISLVWGPDSNKIAYIDNHFRDPETGSRGKAVWIVNLDTFEKEIIWGPTVGAVGKPISLNWSPDGRKIGLLNLLVRQGLGLLTYDLFDIYMRSSQTVMDIRYEPRFCGGVLPDLIDVYWTRESAKVVLSFPEGCWKLISPIFEVQPTLASPGLWLFEEGKEPKLLSDLTAYSYIGIDVSPDGTFIAFMGDALYTINIDGSNLKKIAEGGGRPKIAP